jgi:cysteinyl-tRNA synthetase
MAKKFLGNTIDIHAGGADLQFPHHENEIAQSEAHNGCTFANYWMHNGYINVDGTKMSKSLGNFKTVRDLLQVYDGETLRFLILSGHYRGPIDFCDDILTQSKNGLTRMRNAKSNLKHLIASASAAEMTAEEAAALEGFGKHREAFIEAMDDDLNTADAITAVFQLVTDINTAVKNGASKEFAQKALETLTELTSILGLLEQEVEETVEVEPEIQALIDERQAARKAKNFARADEIRDILKEKGITLKDTPQGVQIIRA